MFELVEYADILKFELQKRKTLNPSFSLRSFAGKLELRPSELSEYINKKRKLGLKKAKTICLNLGYSEIETEYFLSTVDESFKIKSTEDLHKRQLDIDSFMLISNWYSIALLSLYQTKDFAWDNEFISRRLGISIAQVKDSIQRMINLGLIKVVGDEFVVSNEYYQSPDGVPVKAIKDYHSDILELGKVAIKEQSLSERDITGVSVAIRSEDISKIKKEIEKFHEKIINKYGVEKNGDEVYQLESLLFKLTK
jgi:uncharacterized protein (TIGR02147 family)